MQLMLMSVCTTRHYNLPLMCRMSRQKRLQQLPETPLNMSAHLSAQRLMLITFDNEVQHVFALTRLVV